MSRTIKKPYTKSNQCKRNKVYFDKKMRKAADEQVKEWKRFWQTDDLRELDNAGWYGK